jgi:hypothetical protein
MKFKISFATPAQRLVRWERIKQDGIWTFVVLRGVLGWGLSFALITIVFSLGADRPLPLPWYLFVPLLLAFGLTGGFVWGLFMWFFTMWEYSRAKKQKESL